MKIESSQIGLERVRKILELSSLKGMGFTFCGLAPEKMFTRQNTMLHEGQLDEK